MFCRFLIGTLSIILLHGCGASENQKKQQDQQELRVELAELLIQARSYDEAAPILRAALSRTPRDPRLHLLLGITLRDKGVYREAERILRRALELDPRSAEAHSALGVLLSLTHRHPLAIKSHLQSIQLKSDVAQFHNNLGFSYALNQQHELAIGAFERALSLAPTDRRVYINLAFSLGALKRDDEAQRMLSEALSPGEVWHNLGLIYLKRGEQQAAKNAYLRALEQDPRLELAREALDALSTLEGAQVETIKRSDPQDTQVHVKEN